MERFFRAILFPGMILAIYLAFPATFLLVPTPPEASHHSLEIMGLIVLLLVTGAWAGTLFVCDMFAQIERPLRVAVLCLLYLAFGSVLLVAIKDLPFLLGEYWWVAGSFLFALLSGLGNGWLLWKWKQPAKAVKKA